MRNTKESELTPGFRRSKMSGVKGMRTRHVITMNPNDAQPGEELYVCIPKLTPGSCLVPGSFCLLFDFISANTKSWFLNNLSRLLVERLQVKLAGEVAYDNTGESVINVYKDLWKSSSKRSQMTELGLCGENLRKLISKDDSGASSGDSEKVVDALMFKVLGTKQKIVLDKVLGDHGLYAPFQMNNNPRYIITLPKADDIMVAQNGSTVEGYSLKNIELEYETIENPETASDVASMYGLGRSLSYEHVTLLKTVEWNKDSTLENENINIPRKSMKAIVLLFLNKTRGGSEEFVNPNTESVRLTIEGVPNMVYSQGIPQKRFYEEAKRLFGMGGEDDQFMTMQRFYLDRFALVIDLRSVEDNERVVTGKKIISTQSGVLLEITKEATTANVVCKIFVISDGLINVVNNDLKSIQY